MILVIKVMDTQVIFYLSRNPRNRKPCTYGHLKGGGRRAFLYISCGVGAPYSEFVSLLFFLPQSANCELRIAGLFFSVCTEVGGGERGGGGVRGFLSHFLPR